MWKYCANWAHFLTFLKTTSVIAIQLKWTVNVPADNPRYRDHECLKTTLVSKLEKQFIIWINKNVVTLMFDKCWPCYIEHSPFNCCIYEQYSKACLDSLPSCVFEGTQSPCKHLGFLAEHAEQRAPLWKVDVWVSSVTKKIHKVLKYEQFLAWLQLINANSSAKIGAQTLVASQELLLWRFSETQSSSTLSGSSSNDSARTVDIREDSCHLYLSTSCFGHFLISFFTFDSKKLLYFWKCIKIDKSSLNVQNSRRWKNWSRPTIKFVIKNFFKTTVPGYGNILRTRIFLE